MSDLISRQAVIDAIVAWTVEDRPDIEMPTDLIGRIKNLPSAQPDVPDANVGDMIDRRAAIDTVRELLKKNTTVAIRVMYEIERLPSAQPEIIRCKDCLVHGVCRFEQYLGLDGYCSRAERRTDDLH